MKEMTPFNSLFDDAFFNDFFRQRRGSGDQMPAIDVQEDSDCYHIKADLPGVDKDDIKVTLENGVLSVTAETHNEDSEEKEGRVIRRERHIGRYRRSMSVGRDIEADSIKASFENGVLALDLPKLETRLPESTRIRIE